MSAGAICIMTEAISLYIWKDKMSRELLLRVISSSP